MRWMTRLAVVGVVLMGALAVPHPASAVETCFGRPATGPAGTSGTDVLIGTPGPDTIDGLGGDDFICGLDGSDRLIGGLGNDRIDGGANADLLIGDVYAANGDAAGGGVDSLNGGLGNFDFIVGDSWAEAGNAIGSGSDTIDDPGSTCFVVGDSMAATIIATEVQCELSPTPGMAASGAGGNDRVTVQLSSFAILDHAAVNVTGAGDDSLTGSVTFSIGDSFSNAGIPSGAGNDTFHLGNGAVHAFGDNSDFNVTLGSSGGSDRIFGGANGETFFAGPGNDLMMGNAGVDTCDGEGGTDTAIGCEATPNVP